MKDTSAIFGPTLSLGRQGSPQFASGQESDNEGMFLNNMNQTPPCTPQLPTLPTEPTKPIKHIQKSLDFDSTATSTNPSTEELQRHILTFYPHLLAHHAPRIPTIICRTVGCSSQGPFYTCNECFFSKWYCKDCLIKRHEDNPLHEIATWNGFSMETTSLFLLGQVINLIHPDGSDCTSQGPTQVFTILHTTGTHKLRCHQCTCSASGPPLSQLIANKLFPATYKNPQTAFTFASLKLYDVANLKSNINIKQYCDSLLANSPGSKDQTMSEKVSAPDIETQVLAPAYTIQAAGSLRTNFHYAVRLWRYFRVMQEFGFFDYQDVVTFCLVQDCPQCPQPGMNLPEGWENDPDK